MVGRHYVRALSGLMAVLLSQAAWAQASPLNQLLEQGRFWETRGDGERASEVWQRILKIEPDQPEALFGLGMAEAKAGRLAPARKYLAQLRQVRPNAPETAQLEQAIALSGGDAAARLEKARELAKLGQAEQAVEQYRAALGGRAPSGTLAIEYYQTLGFTKNGWDEARAGLQRQIEAAPDNGQARLALAQLLTFREGTRVDGIRQLMALSTRRDIGGAAVEAWRNGLIWLGAPPRLSDAPLFEAYLKAQPDDDEIRQRLSQARTAARAGAPRAGTRQAGPMAAAAPAAPDPVRTRVAAGMQQLESGDIQAAEASFKQALSIRPQDADALGGMGILRLRQQRFQEARDLLQQASSRSGGSRWKEGLQSASYWGLLEQAEAARKASDPARAVRLLQDARKLDAKEPTARAMLAASLAEAGRLDEAERAYREQLAQQPGDADATRGLVGVLLQRGRTDEALRLVDQLSPEARASVGDLGSLRAMQALNLAKQAQDRGDVTQARDALQHALTLDPANPWTRLALARLYMQEGAVADARGLVDGLLVSHPDMPDALYASALIHAEAQDWSKALAALEKVAPANRTQAMADLQRSAWVHARVEVARGLAGQGRIEDARRTLAQAEPYAGRDVSLMGAVAGAYVDARDPGRAMALIRGLMPRSGNVDTGLLLQYAGLLLATEQDVELAGVLKQLQARTLDDAQARNFSQLRNTYIVRQADALRVRGDLATAWDMLAPLLDAYPDDPQVVGALARMHADAGNTGEALGLYRRLLEQAPNDTATLTSAAYVAAQGRDFNTANALAERALAVAPDNPDVLTAAARVYRAQGRNSRAEELLRAAIAAGAPKAAPSGASPASPAPSANPFRRSSAPAGGAGDVNSIIRAAVQPMHLVPPAAADVLSDATPADYFGTRATLRVAPVEAAGPSVAQMSPPLTGQRADPSRIEVPAPAADRVTRPVAAPVPPVPSVGIPMPATGPSAPAAAPRRAVPSLSIPEPVGTRAGAAAPAAAPVAAPAPWSATGQDRRIVPPAAAAPMPVPAGAAPAAPGGVLGNEWPGFANRTIVQSPLQAELAALQAERSPTAAAGVVIRSRQGEAGMSKLTDIQIPVEVSLPVADGQFALRVTPVTLDPGSLGSDFGSSSRFGGGPAAALAQAQGLTGSAGSQDRSGVGLAIAYASRHVEADIGSTPLGFRNTQLVGGVRFRTAIADQGSVSLDLSRRAVTDSVLSFAGAHDNRVGQTWGGVTSNGATLRLGWDDRSYGVYGSVGYHRLLGDGVESNSRVSGGAGVYTHLIDDPGRRLTVGLNLSALSYDKNLRYFTYGHGGYFSPQRFVSLGIPVSWSERRDRWSYQVAGSLGVQYLKEDAALYFPTRADLQQTAQDALNLASGFGLTGAGRAVYAGQSKTGLGYSFGAAMEYRVTPQILVGGQLAVDNSSDYRQWVGRVYMRYRLRGSSAAMPMPLSTFRSSYEQ